MLPARTALRWCTRVLGATALLFGLGTVTLAYAVSHAPNGTSASLRADPCPSELQVRGHARDTSFSSLSTWLVEPSRPARGTIVLLHGVRLDKRSMLPAAETFLDAGYRVVLVDLRGHGHSGGGYLTYGTGDARDLPALLDEIEARGVSLGPVGVHGFSYGAATALELAASDSRVSAVVAVASFASLRTVVRDYVRWQAPSLAPAVPDMWLDSAVDLGALWAGFDADAAAPAEAARRSSAPLLVVHGSDDPQVSVENAHSIERAAEGRARLLLLPGETHASILADARGNVRAAALAWFDSRLFATPGRFRSR